MSYPKYIVCNFDSTFEYFNDYTFCKTEEERDAAIIKINEDYEDADIYVYEPAEVVGIVKTIVRRPLSNTANQTLLIKEPAKLEI